MTDDVDKVDKHITRKYDIVCKLGKGAYAVVFKAIDKKTKDVVAIKKIFDAFQNKTDAQRTFREIAYLLMLQGSQVFEKKDGDKSAGSADAPKRAPHPNIIKLRNFHKAENDKDVVRCSSCSGSSEPPLGCQRPTRVARTRRAPLRLLGAPR
jgi:mitogen-activated protein kinase 15